MHSIRFNKNTSVVVLNLFHNKKIMADLVNKRYQLLKILNILSIMLKCYTNAECTVNKSSCCYNMFFNILMLTIMF